MKSDIWLTEKVIRESLNKSDVSYARKLIEQGRPDEEVLAGLRKRMLANSKGMRAYIRHEKIKTLMVKLSYKVHWVYLLPVMKKWIREKEVLIRWRERNHSEKLEEQTRGLREKLFDSKYRKVKFYCANGGDLPDEVIRMIEHAAEELLSRIEEEERNGSREGGKKTGAPV